MKTSLLKLLTLSLFMFLAISCSKNQDVQPEIQIDGKNLTDCPAGTTCTYWFTENNIFSPNAPYGASDVRMFYAQATTSIGTTTLSIETPRQVNSFSFNDEDIKNGKIKFDMGCAACFTAPFKLIGGSVKGINLSSRDTRPSGSVRWLIEAKVIREYIGSSVPVDTIYVKQYFYPIGY